MSVEVPDLSRTGADVRASGSAGSRLVPAVHDRRSAATALEERCAELELEVVHLRRALESRTLIGVATGLLAERYGCTSTQAWALLRRLSSHANVKIREVARGLVAEVDGMPDDQVVVTLA